MEKVYHYPTIQNGIIGGDDVIITEKIDGSNIGIGYVNGLLHIQSRTQKLKEDTKNFGLNTILKKLIPKIQDIKDILNCDFIVYGEIFGHIRRLDYNDPESKKELWTPDEEKEPQVRFFRAFDILKLEKKLFLKYTDAIEIFDKVKLPYVPILDVKYKDQEELRIIVQTFQSAYSQEPVEGFILKENKEESYPRTMTKLKRENFEEIARKKKRELKKFEPKTYVNTNRFISAYTKIGNNPEEIKEEMIKDTLKDIMLLFKSDVKNAVEAYMNKNYDRVMAYHQNKKIEKELFENKTIRV